MNFKLVEVKRSITSCSGWDFRGQPTGDSPYQDDVMPSVGDVFTQEGWTRINHGPSCPGRLGGQCMAVSRDRRQAIVL